MIRDPLKGGNQTMKCNTCIYHTNTDGKLGYCVRDDFYDRVLIKDTSKMILKITRPIFDCQGYEEDKNDPRRIREC